jgi:DNA-binding transcriptional MerR regulator
MKHETEPVLLLATGTVANRLGVSSVRVRQLCHAGVLQPAVKTSRGWRLFDVVTVERLALARSQRRSKNRRYTINTRSESRDDQRGSR